MKKLFGIFAFGLLALIVTVSIMPSFGLHGHKVAHEKHQVVKKAFNSPELRVIKNVYQASAIVPAAVMPKCTALPKTKVYCRKAYFGMIIGSDISHHYARANISFRGDPRFYRDFPPLLNFS